MNIIYLYGVRYVYITTPRVLLCSMYCNFDSMILVNICCLVTGRLYLIPPQNDFHMMVADKHKDSAKRIYEQYIKNDVSNIEACYTPFHGSHFGSQIQWGNGAFTYISQKRLELTN